MRTVLSLTVTVLLAAYAGLATADAGAAETFDVTYLWDRDPAHIRDYRREVGAVLGPAVARNLKIARRDGEFGLVYSRDGDGESAARVAKSHTRLLRRAGLGEASPIPRQAWDTTAARAEPAAKAPIRAHRAPPAAKEKGEAGHALERAIEAYIAKLRREGRLAADERTGWSVRDLTTGEQLVTINEDDQFQAASLIKPFIAAAFFHKVERGDFIYGPKSQRHIYRMIHWSHNGSTNWVMRQVGGPAAVQRILETQYPEIFLDTRVVEFIPPGGRTYRNKASAHDYSRFLQALWNDEIPGAKEIRRLMALPGNNRLFSGKGGIPEGAEVYNKTGSTAKLCGDMGILVIEGPDGQSHAYSVVAVIEKRHRAKNYTSWIRSRSRIIADASDIVYRGIARRHGDGEQMAGSFEPGGIH